MGAGCTTAPINSMDIQYAKKGNTAPVTLPPQNITDSNNNNDNTITKTTKTNRFLNVRAVTQTTSSSSNTECTDNHRTKEIVQPQTKKNKNKNKIPRNRRRKSIRKKSFDTNQKNEYEKLNPHASSNKSFSSLLSNEYIDYPVPNLPLRFSKSNEIWDKEYTLFTETLSNILHSTYKSDKISAISTTKLILEFAEIDIIYKLNKQFPINRGLWPHEYILDASKTDINMNENGMIIKEIRDELIDSFNFQSIFEICGSCFSTRFVYNSNFKMRNFFIYGVYNNRYTGTWNSIISEFEANDGYTSTTSSATAVNPLKFNIYSHDITICKTGFHIERHNEYYEQCDMQVMSDNDQEPSYYFTLLLLPPNIQTYQGGSYKFYDVENTLKSQFNFNGSRHCTPTPPVPLKTESSEPVLINADLYDWTWILFDKRVEYECNPIIDGTGVAFKMDIDIWKKSMKEIKQNEESHERINKLLSGELIIDLNEIRNDDREVNRIESPFDLEPSVSPNIVFPPYPILQQNV